ARPRSAHGALAVADTGHAAGATSGSSWPVARPAPSSTAPPQARAHARGPAASAYVVPQLEHLGPEQACRLFLKLHKRLRFDGAQTQSLVLALQLLDATLLLIPSWRQRRVLGDRPPPQATAALQVA